MLNSGVNGYWKAAFAFFIQCVYALTKLQLYVLVCVRLQEATHVSQVVKP